MTQVRNGNMQHNNQGHPHHPDPNPNHQPQNVSTLSHDESTQFFSHPNTPPIPNADNNPTTLNPTTLHHHQADHANLYLAIFSLNLGNASVPPTPVNSPTSSPGNAPLHPKHSPNLNMVPEEASQGSYNEENAPNNSLR